MGITYLNLFAKILTIFTNLQCFNFNSCSFIYGTLFLGLLRESAVSSTLLELHINVSDMKELHEILDGRFDQLRKIYISIVSIVNLYICKEEQVNSNSNAILSCLSNLTRFYVRLNPTDEVYFDFRASLFSYLFMNNKILVFIFGFLVGLIILYFYKRLKYFLRYDLKIFSLHKHELNDEEKCNPINSSKIWMYELRDTNYNSHTFSMSMTNICLIKIEKNYLFIFQPSKELSHKLDDNELYSKVSFNQIRIYNLNKGIIGLLPLNMISSKYWSKKCPIVLENILYLRNEFIETSSIDSFILSDKTNVINVRKTLFLFTRTRRSKEDWFYRFLNASQIKLWKNEIYFRLEQNKSIDEEEDINKTENVKRKKIISSDNDDKEYKKRLMEFLKRTDRFASPDQLLYSKYVQRFERNSDKVKINHDQKYSLEDLPQQSKFSEDIRSLSSSKQQYYEQWLTEENSMNTSKKPHCHHNLNENHIERKLSQTNPSEFHPLLFFILTYLQKLSSNTNENKIENPIFLLNIFATRCFLDIFNNEQYLRRMELFLQKQLQKIQIPFIEHIHITNLNLGDRLPEIKNIFEPWIDEYGLWSHIKISYNGRLQLTFNAKVKWIRKNRVTEQISVKNISLSDPKKLWRKRLWPPSQWFRRFNHKKLKKSEHPSSYNFEKVVPRISKTSIVVKLEVNNLNGILLFNIPPIPSDRIWLSFFEMPQMEFSAIPHLGEYRMPFYKIKNRLEKKLRQIFYRYLVMPNMKDFIIPTMNNYLSDNDIIRVNTLEKKIDNQ